MITPLARLFFFFFKCPAPPRNLPSSPTRPSSDFKPLPLRAGGDGFKKAPAGLNVCRAGLPRGWNGAYRHFKHPFDYLGSDGGGGVGAGPGMIVGAALALKDSGRIVAGGFGGGGFLLGGAAPLAPPPHPPPRPVIVAHTPPPLPP